MHRATLQLFFLNASSSIIHYDCDLHDRSVSFNAAITMLDEATKLSMTHVMHWKVQPSSRQCKRISGCSISI